MTKILLNTESKFCQILKRMQPFMSTERYCLNGIYFEYEGGKLTLTATNGHFLYNTFIKVAHIDGASFKVICPAAMIDILVKVLRKYDKISILVDADCKTIEFDNGYFAYRAKCIEQPYPDYTKVIPKAKLTATHGFNSKYLRAVLKALDNQPIDIMFNEAGKGVHVFTTLSDENTKCIIMPMRMEA